MSVKPQLHGLTSCLLMNSHSLKRSRFINPQMVGRQCEGQKRGIQQNETKNKADKLSLLTNWSLMVKLHKLSWQSHIPAHLSIQQLPRCVMWWPRTAQGTEMECKSLKSAWLEYYHLRWIKEECRATKSLIHLFGGFFPSTLNLSSDQFYPCLKLFPQTLNN